MKKKVLFIGPIGGIYGRDVEVNLVAKSLMNEFDLAFFSTCYWQKNSTATKGISKPVYSSLALNLTKNPILYFFSRVSWVYNGFKTKYHNCLYNKINRRLIRKYEWDIKIMKQHIKKCDVVICFVQLGSKYLENIIEISKSNNIKIIIRPTGTIYDFPLEKNTLEKVDLFIHHSTFNKNRLKVYLDHPYKIIDQASGIEKKLLKIKPIKDNNELVFGFLGRYSDVKGIDEIVNVAEKLNIKLILAGDGIKKKVLLSKITNSPNITDLGQLNYTDVHKFFEKIDIFIINSKHETGPLTGVEAMCAARFIISREVGAMPKRLKSNTNKWIKSNLKTSIEDVLKWDKQKIINIGNENRKTYMTCYSLSHLQKKYLQAVKSVTHAKR